MCFCLAREHPLNYVPICTSCGFILCTLNTPEKPCLSCNAPFPDSDRDAYIADKRAKAERQRQQMQQAKAQAQGAFPALPSATPKQKQKPPPQKTHKVLSLSSKRITISTTNTNASTKSEPAEVRYSPPPETPDHSTSRPTPSRPWQNLLIENPAYTTKVL